MAKTIQREKAQALRRKGYSISHISNFLKESKSSVGFWCRDITLNSEQIKQLKFKQRQASLIGLMHAAERKRNARIIKEESMALMGAKDVGKISGRDYFMIGLALYWGEGYKRGTEVGFTNSDPIIIKLMMRWFVRFYHVQPNDFILRVSINNTHKNRIKAVTHAWSKITTVPTHQFTAPSFIKSLSKKIYSDNRMYIGTLRFKVRRGTDLRRRILGSLKEIGELA